MSKKVVVTGGSGFIGAHLVKKMVSDGWNVCVVDSLVRGDNRRLQSVVDDIELINIDIRDELALRKAIEGAEAVFHLAAVNGTENFYNRPELVLDVGIQGAIAVVNACRNIGVPDLVVASSAEVYQTPSVVPTPEDIPLMLPNSLNPRYSYGGSKIISELIAFNYAQDHFRKVQVFRPHNIYGPDMGWKHVVPQFALRMAALKKEAADNKVKFPIKGSGEETRAFCYVDDAVNGIITMYEKGEHRNIYHIGNDEEVSIKDVAVTMGDILGVDVEIDHLPEMEGGTNRRCPDISKMKNLGYTPQIALKEGLSRTIDWYMTDGYQPSENDLM